MAFRYPYNNFIHHHAEQIIVCCLESKNASLVEHILEECNLVRSIIDAEGNSASNTDKKTDMVNFYNHFLKFNLCFVKIHMKISI